MLKDCLHSVRFGIARCHHSILMDRRMHQVQLQSMETALHTSKRCAMQFLSWCAVCSCFLSSCMMKALKLSSCTPQGMCVSPDMLCARVIIPVGA